MKRTKRRPIEWVYTCWLPLYVDLSTQEGGERYMRMTDTRWNKAKLVPDCKQG